LFSFPICKVLRRDMKLPGRSRKIKGGMTDLAGMYPLWRGEESLPPNFFCWKEILLS
jgi:hypothetical protein